MFKTFNGDDVTIRSLGEHILRKSTAITEHVSSRFCRNKLLQLLYLVTRSGFGSQNLQIVSRTLSKEGTGLAESAPDAVPQCEVLPVVVIEIQVVVCVMCGSIDDGF